MRRSHFAWLGQVHKLTIANMERDILKNSDGFHLMG